MLIPNPSIWTGFWQQLVFSPLHRKVCFRSSLLFLPDCLYSLFSYRFTHLRYLRCIIRVVWWALLKDLTGGPTSIFNPTWKLSPHKSDKIDCFNLFFETKVRLKWFRVVWNAKISFVVTHRFAIELWFMYIAHMYIRRIEKKNKNSDKKYLYYRLVHGYKVGDKVRQQTLLNLVSLKIALLII